MIKFKVAPDDGEEFELTATARDVLMWEKTTKGSFQQLQDNQRMTDLYRIAYIAAKRLGLYDGPYADFEATCDLTQLEGNADNAESDPTKSAP